MDRLIYSLLSGMRSRTSAQTVTANNIANASTPGFRRELTSQVSQYLGNSRAQAQDSITTAAMEPGKILATGEPLDIAVEGDGWLAVQAENGDEAYTRRGDLHVAATGLLETGDGHPVLGNTGPVTIPPGGSVSISHDGSISVVPTGATNAVLIDRIRLVNPDPAGLRKANDGLFRTPGRSAPDIKVRLHVGALESSNVQVASVLADMVEQSRGFDVSAKLLSAARDIDTAGSQLMRLDN
ncbi:MAG: flagellar basal body rod protein FlgF [Polymorphobacter sp.]